VEPPETTVKSRQTTVERGENHLEITIRTTYTHMEKYTNLIAGFSGGVLGSLVAHPIDTIRVRYQTINYPSILETIKDTYKQGRFKGFYRGITFPLIGISFEKAIVFSSYNFFKTKNPFNIPSSNPYLNIAISGYITGLLTTTVMSPIEVLKTHYQYNLSKDNPLKSLSIKSKLKTITNGYLATAKRESIGYSSYFLTYEFLEKNNPNKSLIPIYGGLCALVSWSIIYPFDLIKNIKIIENKTYSTISKELYQHNGIKGFYRGFWLAQLRAIPYHSAVWTGYKLSKDFLDKRI
jgi:Mitochondrial carrier protein